MTELNEQLDNTWVQGIQKIGYTDKKSLLYSTTNYWSRQAYMHGFVFDTVKFKDNIKVFQMMDIDENIY